GPSVQSPLVFDDLIEYSIERLTFEGGQPGAELTTEVMLGEQVVTLTMQPHSLRAADFQVLVQREGGELERWVPPAPTTYRGVIEGMDGSTVVGSYFDGSLKAFVDFGGDEGNTWFVQPLTERLEGADESLHVVHREADDISALGGFCGTADDPLAGLGLDENPQAPGTDMTLLLELAIDTDFEFFQLRGSSEASVIAAVEAQVNAVSNIYERDVDTEIEITTIIVRSTSADPYTTSDGGGLLQQMTNHWNAQQTGVRRDTASLISGRNFAGGTLGVAWLPGTCTSNRGYNVNQYVSLGASARIAVHAHELGHNNNAPHCSGGDCRIMCAGIGGCAGDISRFGASSISRIRSYLDAAPCIGESFPEPDPQPLPFEDTFDASTEYDPNLWTQTNGVRITSSTINPISPPNATIFQPDGVMTTTRFDVPATPSTFVGIWSQHRFVEAGKSLRVEYFESFSGDYELLGTIESTGTTQTQYIFNEFKLPLFAVGDEFRLRISADGLDSGDAFYIDCVTIIEFCRADLIQDGAVNLFDFLAFQTAFDMGSPEADFNNDTLLNVFDFLEFQNQFGAGCD
ncbi:MAG: M12 family metallo-peptidase, partial [Phycisphaerales bacterium]